MVPGHGREQVTGLGPEETTDMEEGCGFTSWPEFYGAKSFYDTNSYEMNSGNTQFIQSFICYSFKK